MAQPIDDGERAYRRQQLAMLKARRERLRQEFLELEARLLPRYHEPEVRQMISIAHRSLVETGEALAVLEAIVNG